VLFILNIREDIPERGGTIQAMDSSTTPSNSRINPRMLEAAPMRRCRLDECLGACCVFGVWADQREMEDILANAEIIKPFMPEGAKDPADWFASYEDHDEFSPSKLVVHTAVETTPEHYGGTACIFWLSDGKCALQVAGKENGFHPWRFKPYYCILHPLDLDEQGRITVDETETLLGEPGSCLRPTDVKIPLVETFQEELHYLLGDRVYEAIKKQAEHGSQSSV
jgi:hypothetical protein